MTGEQSSEATRAWQDALFASTQTKQVQFAIYIGISGVGTLSTPKLTIYRLKSATVFSNGAVVE